MPTRRAGRRGRRAPKSASSRRRVLALASLTSCPISSSSSPSSSSCWCALLAAFLLLMLPSPSARGWPVTTTSPTFPGVTESWPSPPCDELLTVVIPEGSRQLKDSSLLTTEGHVFPVGSYYLTDDSVRGCACMAGTCLFKCCRWGEMKSAKARGCVPANASLPPFQVDVFDLGPDGRLSPRTTSTTSASSPGLPPDWIVVEGRPSLRAMYRLEPSDSDDKFYLLSNASLYAPRHTPLAIPPHRFCLDVFDDIGGVTALVVNMNASSGGPAADDGVMYNVYPVGLLISLPFLVATFAVYAAFGELRNLHGKSLMCHVGTMIVAYVTLALVHLKVGVDNTLLCKALGHIIQFSFLACFFWLNIMCFDIWWTFSGFSALRGTAAERERRKFWAYSLYAWGAPLAILVVTVALDELGDALPIVRPQLGVARCFFDSNEAKLAYFFGPVAVLLCCNVLLFLHTAVRILKLRRETRVLQGTESQRHNDDTQRYGVYLKLFVIMGLNWIAEIVSVFFPEYKHVWRILDIGNSLQGIFIFIMFVATGRVRRMLTERLSSGQGSRAVNSHSSTKSTRAGVSNGVLRAGSKPSKDSVRQGDGEDSPPSAPAGPAPASHDTATKSGSTDGVD